MADVFSILYTNSDWWDGTESWGGEANETARDAKYSTRTYSTMNAWEVARDGASSGGDDEYLIIVGPFASADTIAVTIGGFSSDHTITECPVTLNDSKTNPARHAGIFSSTCYRNVVSVSAAVTIENSNVTIDGIQVSGTAANHSSGKIHSASAITNLLIQNCVLEVTSGGANSGSSVYLNNASITAIIKNCVREMSLIKARWCLGFLYLQWEINFSGKGA